MYVLLESTLWSILCIIPGARQGNIFRARTMPKKEGSTDAYACMQCLLAKMYTLLFQVVEYG